MLTSGTGYFLAFTAHSKSTIQIMIVLCVIGSGLYKSTSQTLVESLYGNNDPRRDGAFSMTYTFTNIGVLFGPFLCGLVANQWFATKQGGEILEYGYRTVFLITAIVIWAGALFFAIGQKFVLKDLHHADSAKKSLEEKKELASIPLTQPEKRRMCVILILAFFTIFFWIAYNQASMSIALYMQEFINVTCSHHLTLFEMGASYSMPLMGQVSISYPRLPGGSISSPKTDITTIFRPDMDMNSVWKQTYFMQRADVMLLP